MRQNWDLRPPEIELTAAQLTALVQPVFPGQSVVGAEPTQGGLTNVNLRLRLSRERAPVLLRLYIRDPRQAGKECTLHARFAGRIPVPRVLFFAEDDPLTGHSYALVEWVEGVRLDLVAPTLDRNAREPLGRSLGAALAGIHAIAFPRAGFLDADLRVAEPFPSSANGLLDYLQASLTGQLAEERLGTDLTRAAIMLAEAEGWRLDQAEDRPRLVHGDFGGSNLLVRDGDTGWTLAAVLDWEFALSGWRFLDFGNLLRPPLGELPGFAQAVAAGYEAAGGTLPSDWIRLSRLADLLAWVDFLNRRDAGPALIADARAVIADAVTASRSAP